MDKIDTSLYCVSCDDETSHQVIYLDDEIRMIKCHECSETFGIDRKKLLELYAQDTVREILTKPLRLKEELNNEGPKIVFSLPGRILSKPYRVMKEIFELLE